MVEPPRQTEAEEKIMETCIPHYRAHLTKEGLRAAGWGTVWRGGSTSVLPSHS